MQSALQLLLKPIVEMLPRKQAAEIARIDNENRVGAEWPALKAVVIKDHLGKVLQSKTFNIHMACRSAAECEQELSAD